MKTKKNSVSNSDQNSKSGLLNRTAKVSENKAELLKIDFAARRYNRGLPIERVLHLLQTKAPRFWELAEVVGKWVWIRFDGKQPPTITAELSEFGFHWNNRRQVWQHPCGQVMSGVNYDPRRRYGSFFPADQQAA